MNTLTESLALALNLIAHADAELLRIVSLSLRVSVTACALGAVAGLLLGAWLAVAHFPGHSVAVWLVNTLLALPAWWWACWSPVALASGPLGAWGLLFTPTCRWWWRKPFLVVPLIAALARRLVLDGLSRGRRPTALHGRQPADVCTAGAGA
ncbi:MAG: hypothetical protein IPJ08_14825 [Burkholderiales bacterium]|nr:hypothetical protein [Burkholderiales bacterium]